jgi:carboxymethylenebutenolidase
MSGTASGIRTATIMCGDMPAYLALPALPAPPAAPIAPAARATAAAKAESKAPCVVVMHERYGLVRHTRDLADRFAGDGYVAIAPDFYFSHPDPAALHRGDAGYDMNDAEAVARLTAAIEALHGVAAADPQRIAVMGVCQTARHPLVLAAAREIAAALVWYGAAQPREWAVSAKYPRPLEDIIAALDCPVLGMFGETDHLISVADVRRFRDCLERHNKAFSVTIFRESTSGCVRASTVDAYSYGFHCVVVEQCTYDRSMLSHKVNLFDLHHKYADVMHVDDAIAQLDVLARGRSAA